MEPEDLPHQNGMSFCEKNNLNIQYILYLFLTVNFNIDDENYAILCEMIF